jgi:outer membrane receptor protein involved in Fe transport
MKVSRYLVALAMLLVATTGLLAQSSVTGALTGTVTSDGVALPGATITITSPNLQGSRTAVSDANGNYNFAALPPGDYKVVIALEGLQTVTRNTRVTLAGTARADADLRVSAVSEAITVTASAPAVLETTEVQANFTKDTVDELPSGRTVTAVALLAPGVTANGPGGGMQMSGAMSSDNLILVNGANVQENLRGQSRPLFIEDAIQETTVMTAGVSAEFGRFTGGVVNAITKSGGNEFSGSFRDSFDNPAWTDSSAAGEKKADSKLNQTYEGTLGGRIIRDRLWFFLAGRKAETTAPARYATYRQSTEAIYSVTDNFRYEGKLTGQITPNHSLVANYLKNNVESTNDVQLGNPWEPQAVDPSIKPLEDFLAFHYSGIFTNNLLGEINYSKRNYTFVGFGGDNPDIYAGTPLVSYNGAYGVANAPFFCGACDDEERNNELWTAKATYFLGTKGLGTHNIVAGVEDYSEFRLSNNYQSPTNLTLWMYATMPSRNADGSVTYTFTPGYDTVEYFPVEIPSLGSDLGTQSVFVNDKWDLNGHWSFNLGLRYDATDAKDSFGNKTSDETSFSPRLAATFDPAGNGKVKVNATYGKYVGRLAETVQGSGSPAGEPSFYQYYYDGPEIVSNSSAAIVKQVVDWFIARGGTNLAVNRPDYSSVGGVNTRLMGSLKAPGMDEWTLGTGWQITPAAYVRADYINREWSNYYASFTNLETGQIDDANGYPVDLTLVGNSDLFERTYKAIQLQGNYQYKRLNLGGNYTYAQLKGNAEGEGTGSGPQSEGGWVLQYPEYQGFAQNRPTGYLSGDQRHKLRVWAGMDFMLGPAGVLNASVIQRFDSGLPYTMTASIPAVASPDAPADIADRYISAPTAVTYYFSDRGAFRWDDVTRTDLALNYKMPIRGAEFFVEAEVYNLWNEQAQIGGATTVVGPTSTLKACGGGTVRCAAFNPFTDTPVEGVNYQRLTSEIAQKLGRSPATVFGAASGKEHYQLARTYQFSMGFRF